MRALGHLDFHLEPASTHYTDTLTIYVPERISTFRRKEDNALLYKVMVTHKFLQTELGTYRLDPGNIHVIETDGPFKADKGPLHAPPLSLFLNRFPDPALGEDLFNWVETLRIEAWIQAYLPGLYRGMNRLKKDLWFKRKTDTHVPPRSRIMICLIRRWLTGDGSPTMDPDWEKTAREIHRLTDLIRLPRATVEDTATVVTKAYRAMDHIPGPYDPVAPVSFIGSLRPEEAQRGRLKRREATRVKFREELAKIIEERPDCEQMEIEIPGMIEADEAEIKKPPRQQVPHALLIDGIPVPIPEVMRKIIKEVYEDLGAVPSEYVAVADDMSGHFFRSLCQTTTGTSNVLSEHGAGVYIYDEWDYRREGYRKRWVLLRESDASMGDASFSKEFWISTVA